MTERFSNRTEGRIKIGIVRLPHISNFTDFDVFEQLSEVALNYISKPSEVEEQDLIILPGSKNTIADMKWLRESGMEKAVMECAGAGVPVFGICGGYQIMGRGISDPLGSECGGRTDGMGLLECDTVFAGEKRQTRVSGRFGEVTGAFSCLSGAEFYGYEVHMGVTENAGAELTDCGGCFSGNAAGWKEMVIRSRTAEGALPEMPQAAMYTASSTAQMCQADLYGSFTAARGSLSQVRASTGESTVNHSSISLPIQ